MAGRNCHHVRKSGAEPAAHTIRVISAGGCSLPRWLLGSALTNAGGEPAPRADLGDDKHGTCGAGAVKPAADPPSRPSRIWERKTLEEATAGHRKVRNTARSRAAEGGWGKAPTLPLGLCYSPEAGGGAPQHPASHSGWNHPGATRQGKLRRLLCTHAYSNCFLEVGLHFGSFSCSPWKKK